MLLCCRNKILFYYLIRSHVGFLNSDHIKAMGSEEATELVNQLLSHGVFVGAEKISVVGKGKGDGVWCLHFLLFLLDGTTCFVAIDHPSLLSEKISSDGSIGSKDSSKFLFAKIHEFVRQHNQSVYIDNVSHLVKRPTADLLNSGCCNGLTPNVVADLKLDLSIFAYFALEIRVALVSSKILIQSFKNCSELVEWFVSVASEMHLGNHPLFYKLRIQPKLQSLFATGTDIHSGQFLAIKQKILHDYEIIKFELAFSGTCTVFPHVPNIT